jgi:uncharacterized metal-binding protein YceD (DUF177 family)
MTRRAEQDPGPEFSRPCPLESLGEDVLVLEFEATPEERRALARRFALVSLESLRATLRLRRGGDDGLISVAGRFEAEVTQSCVVTLAPVRSSLAEDFALRYREAAPGSAPERHAEVAVAEDGPPETVGPGGLDLGEAVVQQFAIALDPYPRAPGAELDEGRWSEEPQGAAKRSSPFAVLKDLTGGG